MQESPIHADYEIPAYAGMTRKLTFYECINYYIPQKKQKRYTKHKYYKNYLKIVFIEY